MSYVLIKQRAEDFEEWKAVFDAHAEAREKRGMKRELVFRTMDDSNEIVVIFEWDSFEDSKTWIESDTLQEGWNEAGVKETKIWRQLDPS